MANIDDKSLSSILEKIEAIRAQLDALEDSIKAIPVPLPEPVQEPEPVVEPEPTPEPVEVPEPAPVPEPVVEPVPDEAPLDITISDIELPVPPVIEPVVEESAVDSAEEPVAEDIMDDIPEAFPAPPKPLEEPRKAILDTAKADVAVMDVMADRQAWRTDRPGLSVRNIISAISLNDRVMLINVLFGEDPILFQETIAKFNAMGSLDEALAYIAEHHPDWDMASEPVYRLMMAVRRKLG